MNRTALKISTIVTPRWLAKEILGNPSKSNRPIRVLDGSWHLPSTGRNARKEFSQTHIPSAQFFDIDECCDISNQESPHMLPKLSDFEEYVGALGISNNTHVVVYDNNDNFGIFSAQRVWWTFRTFGHDLVSVVDGGLPRWIKEGFEAKRGSDIVESRPFIADYRPWLVKHFKDVERNLTEKSFTVIDARPAGRFEGTAPEPREGIEPGHIPGSINIPFPSFMDPETKLFKKPDALKELFEEADVDLTKPITATCGSGISACTVALGAFLCGKEDVAIYDGSWTEWFQRASPQYIFTNTIHETK